MGIQYDFINTIEYSADDVNNIRSTLCTKGVLPGYMSNCEVVAGSTTGKVKIQPGTALFESGARITVESGGAEVSYSTSGTNYIYFFDNQTANKCELKASTNAPSGDYVLLATVTGSGAITDRREYSKSKIPSFDHEWGNARFMYIEQKIERLGSKETIIDLGGADYSYFVFLPIEFDIYAFLGWYNAITDEMLGAFYRDLCTTSRISVSRDIYLMPKKIESNYLRLSYHNDNSTSSSVTARFRLGMFK